ncbi:MAG: GNAT family N-acetyltransferase [Candidatus Gastranaerophilales bacterium]|nr:GNAT family N-acetyltransferase [Candidatus Gastranaerophilales bacterium]
MNYRLATLDDIDPICFLVSEVIEQMEHKGIYQWDSLYPAREDFYKDVNQKTLYVVEDEHKLVAIYVINQECENEYHKCEWYNPDETACIIHRLCVAPCFQNKGIGKRILKHIEEQIAARSYTSARLDVYTENPYALKLYKNSGYEERGFADWRKGRFILMEKTLCSNPA